MLYYESSIVNWCETNYEYTVYIAEFWNTITSLFISIAGIYQLKFDKPIGISIILCGIFSAYFHMTLSLLGQLLDELSISVILIITILKIRSLLKHTIMSYDLFLFAIIQLSVQFVFPSINRFILFLYGFVFISNYKLLLHYLKKKFYYNVSLYMFGISVIVWILDFPCFNIPVNFHSIWHISIAITTWTIGMTLQQYKLDIN